MSVVNRVFLVNFSRFLSAYSKQKSNNQDLLKKTANFLLSKLESCAIDISGVIPPPP